LAKSIANEDLGLDNFDITRKIKKIMVEQQKKKKTMKQSQRDEEENEMLEKRPKESMSL